LRDTFDLSTVARVSLHTKAAVIDEKIAVVGSFNLDPRSNYINTETSVIVHDEKFAKALASVLHTGVQIDNSWRLALDGRNRIEWHGSTGVQREPRATFRKRLTARILAWLPVEWLL
jgi:putative cardiolipin synthase